MFEVAIILVAAFVALLVFDVPIWAALVLASFLAIVAEGSADPAVLLASKMANGVNSFALLAIRFLFSRETSWGEAVWRVV